MTATEHNHAQPPDLDSLALFRGDQLAPNAGTTRRGRVRSTWRFPALANGNGDDRTAIPTPPVALDQSVRRPPAATTAGLDWGLVASYRSLAAEELTRRADGLTSRDAQQEIGRAIIAEQLNNAADEQVQVTGRAPWTPAQQDALARAIFNALFRLGRLQPLVDDDSIENIVITGHDRVWLERTDGSFTPGPPVADSDAELVEFISFLASRSGEGTARLFAESHPSLDLRLPDGSRLAATNWVTARPSIVIRRHRLVHVTLNDLVRLGTMTPVMASFLAAAVRARLSIVVAGHQGSGKTTTMRALCNEIDPFEQIATFEDPYELFLHEMPDQHAVVHAWEARHGTGEVGLDGRPAGEYTIERQLRDSFRYNAQRQIVGEIRGAEVWVMLKAMESGSGSLSTTHASSAAAAMAKLVTCSMEAGSHVTRELATSKLGQAIDLVLHLRTETTAGVDGTQVRRRVVSEIVAVTEGEVERGYALTQVFAPRAAGPAHAALLPDHLRGLADHGFDPAAFHAEAAGARR